MSDNSGIPSDWRERIKIQGKEAFELEEMRRLGFWPPDEHTEARIADAEAELTKLNAQMAPLRAELRGLETQIAKTGDVESALREIRLKRIERVKLEREKRREERALQAEAHARQDKARRLSEPPFLGHGVSSGLRFEGGLPDTLQLLGLPALHNATEVATAIGISERELSWLCYHRGAATIDHYHRFEIPKKRGGTRVISAPKSKLRRAQNWLLTNVLSGMEVHAAATAFRPQMSVVDNARRHAAKPLIVRLDLKDFFPSVGFKRVKKMFRGFGYNEGVASLLALLATEAPRAALTLDGKKRFVAIGGRVLPQGACTSPAISNILCRALDARLSGAARRFGFNYSRYADDLIFSGDQKDAPLDDLLSLARKIIGEEEFVVNDAKTSVMKAQNRQVVTGLVVNEGAAPRLSRHDLRRFRAFLHSYEKLGREEMTQRLGQDALAYASGYLSFIHMVRPDLAAQIEARHGWLQRRRDAIG